MVDANPVVYSDRDDRDRDERDDRDRRDGANGDERKRMLTCSYTMPSICPY